ncbi:tetratricopeptide repeat protein [Micromonospora sediminicola]|uniref:tetratricopeptide repeat protein n=1 Tax=Micromonospora sediminicola TaxID=946078 RepID=UPI0037B74B19
MWVAAPLATLIGGSLAAVTAVAASRASRWLDDQAGLRRQLPDHLAVQDRSSRLPRVRDIRNPVLLGVHPVETPSADPQGVATDDLTLYMPRDVDDELHSAVRRESLIVVVGESTAGKSRAAFEAVRLEAPDHLLAVPSGRESLATVTNRLSETRRSVLWLDDLERFLGPNGLTASMVNSLTKRTGYNNVIMATMRTSEWERFTSRAEPIGEDQGRAAWRASRDVLRAAHIITLRRLWSPTELASAATFAERDPRIARALRQAGKFGVAETLAAGPELLRDWHNAWAPGSHPRGAALVAAAVDCRRAGVDGLVPRDLLLELHNHYLLAAGGHALRPEPVEEAWAWALRPVHGASSLLIPAGQSEENHGYLPFDYLIDQPHHRPIPPETWNMLIARADPSYTRRVASEAYWRVRTAFHAAVDSGATDDVFSRAHAMADHGDYPRAIELLTESLQAADDHDGSLHQHRAERHQIAFYQLLSGRLDEAEAAFKELLEEGARTLPPNDEYLQVVRHNLASCTKRRGDLPGALAQFRRILADREQQLGPDAMNTLATRGAIAHIIAEMGDPGEALRQTREILAAEERALGPDHTNTLATRHSLAQYLARSGNPSGGIKVLEALLPDLIRALGADHPDVLDTRSDLARYHRQNGDRSQAALRFQEVLADLRRIHGAKDRRVVLARQDLEDLLAQPE